MIDKTIVDNLVECMRQHYPGWDGFQNRQFVQDEIEYKQKTADKARELLGREALQELLDKTEYSQFIERVRKIGSDNNLLYKGVPSQGDLNVLYVDGLDERRFCEAFFELVYGEGPAESRLEGYLEYLEDAGLPLSCVKWTFPTYFLFFCHPETEFFVKPTATEEFLSLLEASEIYATKPSGESYSAIREKMNELKNALQEFNPQDMIDIQSLVWVIVTYGKEKPVLTKRKKDEFAKLYAEFVESYLRQEVGKDHARRHLRSREEGRRNFEEAVQKKDAGEDVTDFVLLKLLPHSDTPNNSERGAWVSVAPALKGDVKTKFEGADWAKAEDWPAISAAILDFVQRCQGYPMDLREACIHFANLPHSKGLKAGMLSPILNAVDPEKFYLVNNKAYSVVNHFAGTNYKQSILTYSICSRTG